MSFLCFKQSKNIFGGLKVVRKMENYGYHSPFFTKNQPIFEKSGDKVNKMVFFVNLMNFIERAWNLLTLFWEKDKMF